jgi:hypothetical protein
MAWLLQFPRAEFRTTVSAIQIALETRLHCSVSGSLSGSEQPLLSLAIVPSESSVPLNVDFPTCSDAYVRESDLIALYSQQYPWPFSYQADFRYRDDLPDGMQALELWLSVSTSMLECNPKLHLIPETRVQPSPVREIAIANHGRSALIVHPLDFADCEPVLAGDFKGVGHWDVFGGFMEKGVIRRARFLCAWNDVAVPFDTWKQILDWFSQSPLPLTA